MPPPPKKGEKKPYVSVSKYRPISPDKVRELREHPEDIVVGLKEISSLLGFSDQKWARELILSGRLQAWQRHDSVWITSKGLLLEYLKHYPRKGMTITDCGIILLPIPISYAREALGEEYFSKLKAFIKRYPNQAAEKTLKKIDPEIPLGDFD